MRMRTQKITGMCEDQVLKTINLNEQRYEQDRRISQVSAPRNHGSSSEEEVLSFLILKSCANRESNASMFFSSTLTEESVVTA